MKSTLAGNTMELYMKNKEGKKRRLAVLTAVILTAVSLRELPPPALTTVHAMPDEGSAVHITPDDVEDSTLAIGTHLIYLGELNDQIYKMAKETAEDSGQTEMYYKSELGDGAWYAISSAASLGDIMKADSKTDSKVVGELFFTYHTRSDGVTYDLRTNEAVNVFDIVNPYDLDHLPELDQLRNQMETLVNTGTDIGLLEDFFREEEPAEGEENRRKSENETTRILDGHLESLYEFEQRLRLENASEDKIEMTGKVMEKVDAARRYEADKVIAGLLNTLLDQVSSSKELSSHSDLTAAVGNCIKEVQDSMDEADAKQLYIENSEAGPDNVADGSNQDETGQNTDPEEVGKPAGIDGSALSHVEQELMLELLDALDGMDDDSAGSLLDEMAVFYHLTEGISLNPEREKELLDNRLIPAAEQLYEETGSETSRNELEYFRRLREQLDGTAEEGSELNTLYGEKQSLHQQRMSALDQGGLSEAKRLEDLIEDVEEEIGRLEADGIYGDGSASQSIEDIKADAFALLDEAQSLGPDSLDTERLSADIEGIGALWDGHSESASEAVTAISQKLSALQDMQEEPDAGVKALLDKTGEMMSENFSSLHDTIEEDTIEEALEQVTQASLTSDDARENAAALAGISMFCGQVQSEEDSAAVGLLETKAQMVSAKKDGLVFQNLTVRPGSSYVPVDKIALLASMRYVWKENQKKAVLAQGGTYYGFTAFSQSVEKAAGKKGKMKAPAYFQSVIYLPADYIQQEFSYQIYSLAGTEYSVLIDTKIADKASEVCDAILKERRK